MRALPAMHRWFADRGIGPTYLVTWPVVADAESAAILRAIAAEGGVIGSQLHPWVTPPFDEELGARNSFAGNLPASLEAEKLSRLTSLIEGRIGARPRIYRAGRYGIGAATPDLLVGLGYRLDTSIRSGFDYRDGHGPDFLGFGTEPLLLRPGLAALPLGVGYPGVLGRRGEALLRSGRTPQHIVGLLSRLGLSNRVPLTPEGTSAREAARAIDAMLAAGPRLFSLSFHSPSLVPGHTPYVADERALDRFDGWWTAIVDHLARRDIKPIRADELADVLIGASVSRANGGEENHLA